MSSDEITKPDNLIIPLNGDRWATEEHRTRIMAWALERQGAGYIWGAKGPEHFDCSGFCVAAMVDAGLVSHSWLAAYNAAHLFAALEPTEDPQPLDLVFYGQPEHISHVVFLWDDGRTFGASGGNPSTTTAEIAAKAGACVKFKPSIYYRPDCRGFRKLPTPKESRT